MDLSDKSMFSSISSNMNVELCLVCGDRASGRHYGAISCEGCKGFFKRSIRKQLGYQCRGSMNCEVTKHHRNRCQFCRLQKCLASGMRSDSVQHERKPIVDKRELVSTTNTNPIATTIPTTTTAGAESIATENTANSTVFPVGFSLSNLQNLHKRSLLVSGGYPSQIQYTQSQAQFLLSQPYQQQDAFSHSSAHTNDEDSMDNTCTKYNLSNAITNFGLTSDTGTTSFSLTAAATAGFIQTSIDRNIKNQSLDIAISIQQQYISPCNSKRSSNDAPVKSKNKIERANENTEEIYGNGNPNPNIGDANKCSFNDSPKSKSHIESAKKTVNLKLEVDFCEETLFNGNNGKDSTVPLLPEQNIGFNLQAPAMVPSCLNTHYVCECGSRLLFLSIYWMKKISSFQQIPEEIQISLLRRHWVELFAIGLAQRSQVLSISTIMCTLVANIVQLSEFERVPATKIKKLSEHAYILNDFIQMLQMMELDEHEYAYLRLITVFSPDYVNEKYSTKRTLIEKFQDYALKSLKIYLSEINHPSQNDRCSKLLLRLMQIRALESEIVEELFFANLIGHIQIENMIPYILKLGSGET